MIFAVIGAMNATLAGPTPSVSTPTVTSTSSGACSGSTMSQSASLRIAVTVTNPDATNYAAKLYENGIQLGVQQDTAASLHWDKVVGAVEDGTKNRFQSNWVYRVDIVRKSDSVVVSSQTAASWVQYYGQCGGAV